MQKLDENQVIERTENDVEESLLDIWNKNLSSKTIVAMEQLSSERIPPKAIKRKGGSNILYIDHPHITKLLNAAFKYFWSSEISDPIVYDDGSASVVYKLILKIPMPNGTLLERVITDIGTHNTFQKMKPPSKNEPPAPVYTPDGKPVFDMCKSDILASAASRGLVKCVMRAFNYGIELYDPQSGEAPPPTPEERWAALVRRASRLGVPIETLRSELKEKNYTLESFADEEAFLEAHGIIYRLSVGGVPFI